MSTSLKTPPAKTPPCPECEKLKAVSEYSQKIGEFLTWLVNVKQLDLSKYQEVEECQYCGEDGMFTGEQLMPYHTDKEQLLAEFFGIDLKKVEEERRALLSSIQEK